jgi:hypothetical protein
MKKIVTVNGHACEITLYQKSPSVWEAVGTYAGATSMPGTEKEVRVKAPSPGAATKRWIDAARYRAG